MFSISLSSKSSNRAHVNVLGCLATLNNSLEKSDVQLKLAFRDTACKFTHKNSDQEAFKGWAPVIQGGLGLRFLWGVGQSVSWTDGTSRRKFCLLFSSCVAPSQTSFKGVLTIPMAPFARYIKAYVLSTQQDRGLSSSSVKLELSKTCLWTLWWSLSLFLLFLKLAVSSRRTVLLMRNS